MHVDIRRYISHCLSCQQTKYETQKPTGLLQPLPTPSLVWEDLSLDFITGLPLSNGVSTILVVVYRFSKGVHFGTLPPHFMAYKTTLFFWDIVCKLHGFPRSLVSNMDPIFVNMFWREFFRLSGTKLHMSTVYHPQTDDQTEVLNRVLEQYLRSYVHDRPSQWVKFLSLAKWCYNTSVHSGTGFSPFWVIYGKPLPSIPHYLQGSSPVEAIDTLLSIRASIHATLQCHLLKTQMAMKAAINAHRHEVQFKVGDWVYHRLCHYRQTSFTPTYTKLSKRYYNLFRVEECIGPVAYWHHYEFTL